MNIEGVKWLLAEEHLAVAKLLCQPDLDEF